MPPPPFPAASKKRKLAPATSDVLSPIKSTSASPRSSSPIDRDDNDYAPILAATSSKRFGKASGNLGGGRAMSKEALRKVNHSQIERRRREKINASLGELRDMVPGLSEGGAKGGEFKLEVLERTVMHMRELKKRIAQLEMKLQGRTPTSQTQGEKVSLRGTVNPDPNSSATPPSPSLSPDPYDTESDPIPPPPDNASSPGDTYPPNSVQALPVSSVFPSSSPNTARPAQPTRPTPGPQAANPTLYLPFPTPSPTSPFMYQASTTASSTSLPDPSPFLAPMQNISLFGGALNLDHASLSTQTDSSKDKKDMAVEEAANLLLAFSSPDTLRPIGAGMTPKMIPIGDEAPGGKRQRRSTLESEEFVLDGQVDEMAARGIRRTGAIKAIEMAVGKTASDILRM